MIRAFDIVISFFLSVIFFPLILLISFLILIIDGYPIFFLQPRVGFRGKVFLIIKFRTMSRIKKKEQNDLLILTKLGKILRRLSLDEIPQFLNIIKNEMSIVGPRPLPVNIEKKIQNHLKIKRRSMLPGLTGFSQINFSGKKRLLKEKVLLDLKYYNNSSISNYFYIILKTPTVLLKRLLINKSSIII